MSLYALFDEEGALAQLAGDIKFIELSGTPIDEWYRLSDDMVFDPVKETLKLADKDIVVETLPKEVPPPYYLIYDYVSDEVRNIFSTPDNIIFPESLSKPTYCNKTYTKGLKTSSVYYGTFNTIDQLYADPLIKVEYTYDIEPSTRHLLGTTRKISWMMSDGEWGAESKDAYIPMLSRFERLTEVKARRSSVINELKSLAYAMGIEERILELFEKYDNEIEKYIELGDTELYEKVSKPSTSRYPFLYRHWDDSCRCIMLTI